MRPDKIKKDKNVKFRITSVAITFINGFIHEQDELQDDIPDDIQKMILKFINIFFIKLNYNIHNDPVLQTQHTEVKEEKEEKYVHDNDDNNDNKIDGDDLIVTEEKIEDYSKPFTLKYWVLKSNTTIRDIAKKLEQGYDYDFKEVEMTANDYINAEDDAGYLEEHYAHYPYFVNLWMIFKYVKQVYVLRQGSRRGGIKTEKITTESIDKCENDFGGDDSRWVEIPSDFQDATIGDIDAMISKIDKDYILEIGFEKYDDKKKYWPFRNKKLVSYQDEDIKVLSTVSRQPNNTNNNEYVLHYSQCYFKALQITQHC